MVADNFRANMIDDGGEVTERCWLKGQCFCLPEGLSLGALLYHMTATELVVMYCSRLLKTAQFQSHYRNKKGGGGYTSELDLVAPLSTC